MTRYSKLGHFTAIFTLVNIGEGERVKKRERRNNRQEEAESRPSIAIFIPLC